MAVLVARRGGGAVRVDGGPETEVTASGSVIPVARTFTGAVVTVRLAIGAPAAPDPRLLARRRTVSAAASSSPSRRPSAERSVATWRAPSPMARPRSGERSAGRARPRHVPSPARPTACRRRDLRRCGAAGRSAGPGGRGAVRQRALQRPRGACPAGSAGACLDQQPRSILRRQPRPPLGVLLVDDGTRVHRSTGTTSSAGSRCSTSTWWPGGPAPLRITDPEGHRIPAAPAGIPGRLAGRGQRPRVGERLGAPAAGRAAHARPARAGGARAGRADRRRAPQHPVPGLTGVSPIERVAHGATSYERMDGTRVHRGAGARPGRVRPGRGGGPRRHRPAGGDQVPRAAAVPRPAFLDGFREEAQVLRSLDVPQVVRLFDYVEEPGAGRRDRDGAGRRASRCTR